MPQFTIPNASLREVVDAQGNHHAPSGSPTGGQFIPKAGGASGGSPLPVPSSSMASGKVVQSRRQGGGINVSMLVTLEDGTKAIYKPEHGERWRGDFANGGITRYITNRKLSLAEREAMAWEVDQLLGTNLVPETVLRPNLVGEQEGPDGIAPSDSDDDDDDDDEDDEPEYDEDQLREMYEEYKQENWDQFNDAAQDDIGNAFSQAQDEYVENVKARADEITDIWNDLIDEHPEYDDDNPSDYGSRTMLAEHPVLNLGTTNDPFDRNKGKKLGGEVDPLEVLAEARVDPVSKLTDNERDRVRNVLERALQNGASTLMDVDEDRARDGYDFGDWADAHGDTENRIVDNYVPAFDDWMADNGYALPDSRRGGGDIISNKQAPHPGGGSLQKWLPGLDLRVRPDLQDQWKFAVLDYAIGSMDRHGGNVAASAGHSVAIDNGYSMPAAAGQGTIYRSAPVSEWLQQAKHYPDKRLVEGGLRTQLQQRVDSTNWESFIDQHPAASPNERSAFLERISDLKEALRTPEGLYDLWRRQTTM